MAFDMEVGLGPSHIVLDGDPAPLPQKGTEPPPIFGPFLLSPNGWMDQGGTWYGGRPRPRRLCVRWGPSYPQNTGHTHHHPVFGPCLLWPNGWMDEDATWYGSRPRPWPHCIRRVPALRETGTAAPHLFGPYLLWPRHGRPSQLLLSSCLLNKSSDCIRLPTSLKQLHKFP